MAVIPLKLIARDVLAEARRMRFPLTERERLLIRLILNKSKKIPGER